MVPYFELGNFDVASWVEVVECSFEQCVPVFDCAAEHADVYEIVGLTGPFFFGVFDVEFDVGCHPGCVSICIRFGNIWEVRSYQCGWMGDSSMPTTWDSGCSLFIN